ncbi:lipopolysaccharide-induced tumor necrosis factor-alpha factor-like [Ananas comosus]|uniref:Lipopolysaccharide-induced tumor necrosis factor-alpha factor-like n=1 Tax=Ananas comosus TaxID=4615 RepID=A0A6P5GZX1_ANACO|nr:lipopolysaccharide-induced tumor necrosis factor-alpha factor-like [Ananas comosus]
MATTKEGAEKGEEPALGIPYPYSSGAAPAQAGAAVAAPAPAPGHYYYVGENPYQAGMIPPNAVVGDPKGIPLRQTMFGDTPAPLQCPLCGASGLSTVRSKPSLAAVVACMMPFMLGVCFLCPSMDCLWHKYHYCPSCGEKVGEFKKLDPCLVVDPTRWNEPSFAVPA